MMKVVLDRPPGSAKSVRIIADEFVYSVADIDERIKMLHIARQWIRPKLKLPADIPAPKKKGQC